MSQPTRAEAQACFEALFDGVSPGDETLRRIGDLESADLSDPLVASALELLKATLGTERLSAGHGLR